MNITKPRLDQFKITGSTVGDVHFPKVKWLSPFDGSNGATTTTDSSDSNSSLTLQGSTQISTAQSKFGGSSMYVPSSTEQGVYANVAGTTVNLTGDFTIEYWFHRVQVSYANNMAQLIYGMPLSIWFAAGLLLPYLDRFYINHYLSKYSQKTIYKFWVLHIPIHLKKQSLPHPWLIGNGG